MKDIITRVWRVNFLQTARGEYSVKEFIVQQNEGTHAKILQYIMLLRNNGPFLKPPYVKKLQDKLYELRIPGLVAIRIFYTLKNGEYYLLHAFKKKSQKIPRKELQIAIDRMKIIV